MGEKVVEVPHVLREEVAVEVPQIQTCEVLRQDAVAQTKEVIKQIPRAQMQYRERVVELRDQVRQEQVVVPQVQQVAYIQQPQVVEYVQQQPQTAMYAPATPAYGFQVGQSIKYQARGNGMWYPGRINGRSGNGWRVVLNDGLAKEVGDHEVGRLQPL